MVDVRDAPEVEKSGKVAGAVHVSRGMLEFCADPELPYHDKNFAKDKTVILYCASGGRSALGGKVLKDMGYGQVYNVGAFKDWAEKRRCDRKTDRHGHVRTRADNPIPWPTIREAARDPFALAWSSPGQQVSEYHLSCTMRPHSLMSPP